MPVQWSLHKNLKRRDFRELPGWWSRMPPCAAMLGSKAPEDWSSFVWELALWISSLAVDPFLCLPLYPGEADPTLHLLSFQADAFHLSWEMAAGNCSFGGQRGMVMFSLLPPWRRLLTRWSSLHNFRCNSKHTIPTLAPSASFNYGWERLRRPDSHGSAWSPAEAWVLNHLKLYLLLFKNRTTSRNGRSGLPTQKTRGWTTFVLDTSI